MKTLSKPLNTTTLGLILSLSILPFNALAVTSSTVTATTTGSFCTNLTLDESRVTSAMSERVTNLDQNRSNAATALQEARAKFDLQVTTNRANWDASRQANFNALEAKATTSAEQSAVSTFETTVLADVSTHRSTIDNARDTFRSAEDSAISSRISQVDMAVSTFQSSVSSAESAAQSGCDSGTKPATVRETFVASMKSARIAYQTSIAAVPKIDDTVAALGVTRRQAVQTADTTFTAAVVAAGKTLKTALHQ
jgi:hypothetical protein